MLIGNPINKTGKTGKIKKAGFGKYTWYLTGNKEIDSYMANLDMRYQLLIDKAPKDMQRLYNQLEDINYHAENADMVSSLAKWISESKDAKQFDYSKWKKLIEVE
jgi:hypothetical protein